MTTIIPDFYAKQGETFSVRATLKGADQQPQNLALATSVKLTLIPKGGGAPVYDKVTCAFIPDATGTASYDSPAVIDPATVPPGLYELDFTVAFPGSPPIVHKFPDGGPNGDRDAFLIVKISRQAS